MKKIFYSILAIAALSLTGCNGDNDPNDGKFGADSDVAVLRFMVDENDIAEYTLNCTEESINVSVPVKLYVPGSYAEVEPYAQTSNNAGLTVDYTVTDATGLLSAVNTSGSVVLAPGSLVGYVPVTIPAGYQGPIQFDVDVTAVSRDNIYLGSVDEIDPLTIRVSVPSGLHTVYEAEVGSTDYIDYESVVRPGAAAGEVSVSNLWNIEEEGGDAEITFILNEDGTVSFKPLLENYLYQVTGVGNIYFKGISGTHSTCDGTIQVQGEIRYGTNQQNVLGPYNFIFQK